MFDEIARVLTPQGTVWLNLADAYTSRRRQLLTTATPAGKQPLGVPWRAALRLQERGWILRNAIVWAKPNPMPSSVKDRFTTTYEHLFLLTRAAKYWFDLDSIRVPLTRPEALDGTRVIGGSHKGRTGGIDATTRTRGASVYGASKHDHPHLHAAATAANLRPTGTRHNASHPLGRNPGDVWTLPTRPYHGAHVAPFPIDLPLRAIAAGCPPAGVVCDPYSGTATTGLAAA
ncbi:site-specific DNA-methyltransferase (cytosine-N4-specific) [Hamadaea flava]|nr:site-specific DNA-methyltransferase (cytosine-N4-specific) [Hamadaea flava]